MSTRRLIVTALLCGMAILLAGGVFLVRVARDGSNTAVFQPLGQPVQAGDVTVTVATVTPGAGSVVVSVVIDAGGGRAVAPLADAAAPWTLRSGATLDPVAPSAAGTTCRGQGVGAGARVACDLAFSRAGGATYLLFTRDRATYQWRLA